MPERTTTTDNPQYPLNGVTVLDLTHVLSGPFCTLTLAQLGANVIKIEPIGSGDSARSHGAWREKNGRRAHAEPINLGRGKRSVAVDLKNERGRKIILDLVAVSDVVVENFRPKVMERLRLGYADLAAINPKIIYLALSGFGHDDTLPSPYRDRPAFNPIAQGMSGLAYLNGFEDRPPVLSSAAIGDFVPGLYAALGIVSALYSRSITGRGAFIDVAMYDSLVPLNARALMLYALQGEVQERGRGSRYSTIMGHFRVSDGYVVLTVRGDPMWKAFCIAIERPDLLEDPRLNGTSLRGEYYESYILPILEEWGAKQTKVSASRILLSAGIAAGPMNNTADIFADEHIKAREMLVEVGDMLGGTVLAPGLPIKFKGLPWQQESESEWLGASTRKVLRETLKMSDTEINELLDARIVQEPQS